MVFEAWRIFEEDLKRLDIGNQGHRRMRPRLEESKIFGITDQVLYKESKRRNNQKKGHTGKSATWSTLISFSALLFAPQARASCPDSNPPGYRKFRGKTLGPETSIFTIASACMIV